MLNVFDATLEENVYLVILNWNNWPDTIECLESVFRINYSNFTVIVCDNDSQDKSLERIKDWADGRLSSYVPFSNSLQHFSFPPVEKPIQFIEYERFDAEAGGKDEDSAYRLRLISTGGNLGFAGGNNVGLRYALARDDFSYIWLLNNDTVIDKMALSALVRRMMNNPDAGLCGSTLIYYSRPNLVQALAGAIYNPLLATSHHIGAMTNTDQTIDCDSVENEICYIVGASMLVSKDFLHTIGLMSEDYFLYFEEIDWACRAKGRFRIVYSPESIVYHKEGGSIGSSFNPILKTDIADYYGIQNRLVFTRKHYPLFYPFVYLSLFLIMFNRIKRRQWDRVRMVWKIMYENLRVV